MNGKPMRKAMWWKVLPAELDGTVACDVLCWRCAEATAAEPSTRSRVEVERVDYGR
jgi:hypothetical protein